MGNRLVEAIMVAALIAATVLIYKVFAPLLVAWGGLLASVAFIGWCLAIGYWLEARANRH